MVNEIVVKAYLRRYTKAQIEAALDAALANHASGVVVTSLSFEGGASSGALTGDTETLIETLTACLEAIDEDEDNPVAKARQAFVPVVFPAGG
jgi:hypothetical protein